MRTKTGWLPEIRIHSDDRLKVEVESVPIEPLPAQGGGTGWGSQLLVSPDRSTVYWSRAYGQTPKPWSELDLSYLTIRTTARRADGLHGDLRDAILDVDARHAWMLLTHGFARVDLEVMREVNVLRGALPTYLWRMHDLGGPYFGVTGWSGNTVSVVDRDRMEIVRTVRTPSPDLVLERSGDNELELFAFNAGVRRLWNQSSVPHADPKDPWQTSRPAE